jgi:hypothetical protein
MLTNAPNETLILRPDPALRTARPPTANERRPRAPTLRKVALSAGAPAEAQGTRIISTKAAAVTAREH